MQARQGLSLSEFYRAPISNLPLRQFPCALGVLHAGVHFFDDDPSDSIARKALGVNLSDLAAKGARPDGFVLTLALPRGWDEAWLAAFATGLGAMAQAAGCPLLGGDTVSTSGPLTLSITAFGSVPAGRMVLRSGAKPGDAILVSGTIGDGALGLKAHGPDRPDWVAALSADHRRHLVDRYLHPRPRWALAEILQASASAAMDVSDGLVGDLAKLLKASGVGAEIDLEAVPLSDAARAAIMADPALKELASRHKVSVAWLVRYAVDQLVEQGRGTQLPLDFGRRN